jgi:hypothetical protein
MKNATFCDVTPCGSCTNRHFEETYRLDHQSDNNRRTRSVSSNLQLLILFLARLFHPDDKGDSSSETSRFTRTRWRLIPEDDILP